jgi:hypothetical protein
MPISDWLDLMPHTVTYAAKSGEDAYGKPTHGTGTDYTARVTYTHKRVATPDGMEVVASVQVWLNGTLSSISVDDKITLPDGTTPKIVSWDTATDEDGSHHTKLYLSG